MDNNFQRLFYIFKNMDSDIGYPTGYIKVEINCEAAKIQISLNNLLNRQGVAYKLYGIKKNDRDMSFTAVCDIPNINGRADIKVNADSHKIGSNALRIEDISIFAIIAQLPDRISSIKCPLVAYTKGELEWKKEFEKLLLNKEIEIPDIPAEMVFSGNTNDEAEVSEEMQAEEAKVPEEMQAEEEKIPEEMQDHEAEVSENIQNDETGVLQEIKNSETTSQQNESDTFNDKKDDIAKIFEAALTNIYNTEKSTELEQDSVPEVNFSENDILGSAQEDFKGISSISTDGDKIKSELNIQGLKEELDKNFESYNPFKMKSKSLRWWKINSPGFLNNILFRNNVKSYLLFNPKVMLAHYKYRYIIFGIRNEKYSNKEYFICGVPGVYSIDENPFGNMGSWSQLEGYKPKYGAFGYWIILIDPRTGKLIKIK